MSMSEMLWARMAHYPMLPSIETLVAVHFANADSATEVDDLYCGYFENRSFCTSITLVLKQSRV